MLAMANPLIAFIALLAAGAVWVYANWDKLGPMFARFTQSVRQNFGDLLAWFNGVVASFTDIGARMVDGIVSGVRSRWEGLKATMAELAGALPNPVRSVLGIHSPSLVFAEIGGHMIGGVIQGLNGRTPEAMNAIRRVGERLPQAWSSKAALAGLMMPLAVAAQDMAAQDMTAQMPTVQRVAPITQSAAASGAQAGRSGNNQSGDTHHWQINIYPSPGMDEKALAKMVAAELRKHQRDQASNARASLFDRD